MLERISDYNDSDKINFDDRIIIVSSLIKCYFCVE